MELLKAFNTSQAIAYANLSKTGILAAMVPWLVAEVHATRALMGEDFWPYGVVKNKAALDAFLRYHFEQGLSPRKLSAHELFAPETLDAFKI